MNEQVAEVVDAMETIGGTEKDKEFEEFKELMRTIEEEELSKYIEYELVVPSRNFRQVMYLSQLPRKCSKCDNKRVRGWNETGNFPSVCGCVKKVFVKFKENG